MIEIFIIYFNKGLKGESVFMVPLEDYERIG